MLCRDCRIVVMSSRAVDCVCCRIVVMSSAAVDCVLLYVVLMHVDTLNNVNDR